MIIKDRKSNKSNLLIVLSILLLLLIAAKFLLDPELKKATKSDQGSINSKTEPFKEETLFNLIDDSSNAAISGPNVSIHLLEEFGITKLYYIYKDKLNERQESDRFYVHLHLKESSAHYQAEMESDFINLDFDDKQPTLIKRGEIQYYVYSRPLFLNQSVPLRLADISHIETGRFSIKLGVSESYNLDSIPVYEDSLLYSENLNTYCLFTNEKAYQKLSSKRDMALSNGILLTEEGDYVKGELSDCSTEGMGMSFRLKGDWTDHLEHENKWSFRVIMDDGKTLNGMRKFSFQHPRTRNYIWEWLFHKAIKQEGLTGLRYDFCNLVMRVKTKDSVIVNKLGIMAIEESFDKLLIEDNQRRAGVIIGFDESYLWKRRSKQNHLGLGREDETDLLEKAPIKVYNQNKVLSDSSLLKQFRIAMKLLDGLRDGDLAVSEAFDLDKLSTFTALTNLFGAKHGLYEHNIRVYYNPITSKLEPIAFDGGGGYEISAISDYPFASNDPEYKRLLVEKLKHYSEESFIEKLVSAHADQIEKLVFQLNSEFEGITFQKEILAYNSNFIKNAINPADVLIPSLVERSNNQLILEIQNLANFEVSLTALKHISGKRLDVGIDPKVIGGKESKQLRIDLKPSFVNAFVSKKNKNGVFRYPKDVDKLMLSYEVVGAGVKREVKIIPYFSNDKAVITSHKERFRSNAEQFEFVSVHADSIVFKSGAYTIKESIIIPNRTKLTVEPGFSLDLLNNSSIISFSGVNFLGKPDNPIRIYSSDSSGGGLFVSNATHRSIIDHCNFKGLSNPNKEGWEVSGTINFHEADVSISNSQFSSNRSEDLINIIRSDFTLSNSTITSSSSDAFDGDFVNGTISDCKFIKCGNDAIDVSGSSLLLENITIEKAADKAISAGEKSSIIGKNVKVKSGEIGIVCKDLSRIELSNIEVVDTRLGAAIFQKKPEYGAGEVYLKEGSFANNEKAYLVEEGSVFMLNGQLIPSDDRSVSDQLYGVNYGKSSR